MTDYLSILEAKGVLDAKTVVAVADEVSRTGKTTDEALRERGVRELDILEAKSQHWSIPLRIISDDTDISFQVLQYIPVESAKHYQIVPIGFADNVLEVGILDPDNIDALDALNFMSVKQGIPFKVFLISRATYERVLHMYEGASSEVGRALSVLDAVDREAVATPTSALSSDEKEEQVLDDLEATVQRAGKGQSGTDFHEEAPITKIVATVLRSAIESRASDIHIEPQRDKVRVRFRVDGFLRQSLVLPPKVHRAAVARVKILAGIKLDERRKPLDGRFSAMIAGRRVDFRVSTFPTYFGEKAVLRILDSERSAITLEDLGMDQDQLAIVRRAVKAPYGMILITGPTGSGKSTTLYAMLNEVDRESLNVLSLEDPVEYNIPGVSQSQVRPEIGYTFAAGIRSVLRQDPDIIMVGEIRDKETAQLAVQAALTGHLVFSTLHTNNAAGAVPRLVDMGVDPYLLAPTLELIIAQRLVRRLCPNTGKAIPIEGVVQQLVERTFADLPEEYRSKLPHASEFLGIEPTSTCPGGTRGRLGVFEMLEVNDSIRKAVLSSADESTMFAIARKRGMLTLKEDAIKKAMQKLIPYEDIAQVGGVMDLDDSPAENPAPEADDAPGTSALAAPEHDLV